jgi:hypothetical protein
MRPCFFTLFGLAASLAAGCQTAPREYVEESPVLISEVHFKPSDEQGSVEFIEVANVSGQAIDLSGWQVTGAGRVVLPNGSRLGPGQALILCRNELALQDAFGDKLASAAELTGKLKRTGETLRIEDPSGVVADEVVYEESMAEVQKATGTGLSLHRLDPPQGAELWRSGKPTPGVK